MIEWTDERIAELKKRHLGGDSFRTIAMDWGCTRNALIGKSRRLGLAKRRPTPKRMKVPISTAKIRPKIVRPLSPEILAKRALRAERMNATPPDARNISLAELDPHDCRWPTDGEGIATVFCAARTEASGSYCAFHARIAYRSPAARARSYIPARGLAA